MQWFAKDTSQEAAETRQLIRKAEMVESGATTSLADASALISTDVRFPSEAWVAVEKLYAWSVIVDVFHGIEHGVSVAVRTAAKEIGPLLHSMVSDMADSQAVGMDLVCRILWELQQDYFNHVNLPAADETREIPTFAYIRDNVRSSRVDRLASLPISWYSMVGAPSRRGNPTSAESNVRSSRGVVAAINPHVDRRLVQRFSTSPHSSISAMMQG